jgi:hypothetical protein
MKILTNFARSTNRWCKNQSLMQEPILVSGSDQEKRDDPEQKLDPCVDPMIIHRHLIIINGFLKQIKRQNSRESWCLEKIYQEFYRIVQNIINGNQGMINYHVIEFLQGNQNNNNTAKIQELIESKKRLFPVSISMIEIFLNCRYILSLIDQFISIIENHRMESLSFENKLNTFQGKLASFFSKSSPISTKKDMMQFLFDNITIYFSLDIFGSSVFDIDNANDLDIVDSEKKCFSDLNYVDLIDSLNLYFNVEIKTNRSYSKDYRHCRADHYPDDWKGVATIILSYEILNWIPGIEKKNIETLEEIRIKLNYVPRRLFKKTFKSSCDFWEMGLEKTRQGISFRKDLCDHPDMPCFDQIKASFLNKTLTPIKLCEDNFNHQYVCTMECKLSHFYNRIKHIRRYIAKTHIYQITENMPFIQNCIFHFRNPLQRQFSQHINIFPSDLHNIIMSYCESILESQHFCELCRRLLTNNSVMNGKFIIKISFGSRYIHDTCFCEKTYKNDINNNKFKMNTILTKFFCKRDTEIFL